MDVGRSFSFPFREPRWVPRLLLGALLEIVPVLMVGPVVVSLARERGEVAPTVVPLLGLAVLTALVCRWIQFGYLRRIAADALASSGGGLPAWDRFDADLAEGFKLWVTGIVLFIPALAVSGGLALLMGAVGLAGWLWLPLAFILPLSLLATLIYLPAGLANAVAEDSVFAAFDVETVLARAGAAAAAYILSLAVAVATEVLAQFGLMLLCAGIFVTRFLAHCITVHAVASAWREGIAAAPQPLSAGATDLE